MRSSPSSRSGPGAGLSPFISVQRHPRRGRSAGIAAAAGAAREFGANVLINNAGIGGFGLYDRQDWETVAGVLAANLEAPMHLTHALLPWLKSRPEAAVMNIVSTFGSLPFAGFAAYSAAKAGLRGFSKALRRELADSSVAVIHLAPRAIDTPLNTEAVNALNRALKNHSDSAEAVARQVVAALWRGDSERHIGFPERMFAASWTPFGNVFAQTASNVVRTPTGSVKLFSSFEPALLAPSGLFQAVPAAENQLWELEAYAMTSCFDPINGANDNFVIARIVYNDGVGTELGGNDVVILNSDAIVAEGWLDRLQRAAYSAPKIGTATPITNNGTICCYPVIGAENGTPWRLGLAETNRLFQRENDGITVDLPTAVGFCMYIRRVSLPQLAELSLPETVEKAVRAHERKTETQVRLDLADLPEQTSLPVKITAYRVIQEALNNAFRHAGGAGQRVRVYREIDQLTILVSDSGPGFRPVMARLKEGHLGVFGMRERVESLGGQFEIKSQTGQGTQVLARLPLKKEGTGDE